MSEHMRENGYQWCDGKRYMIVDQYTGPERVAAGSLAQGYLLTKEQALELVKGRPGWEHRLFIVEANVIQAFKLETASDRRNP